MTLAALKVIGGIGAVLFSGQSGLNCVDAVSCDPEKGDYEPDGKCGTAYFIAFETHSFNMRPHGMA